MFRSSIILTAIFLMLLVFIVYQNNLSKRNSLLGIGTEHLIEISISYGSDPKEIMLKRINSDWFLNDKKIKELSGIRSILSTLRDLKLEELGPFSDNDELIKYGLDIPLVKLGLRNEKGQELNLYIGDKSPIGNKRYGLNKNNNTVITLDDIYDILIIKEQDLFKE